MPMISVIPADTLLTVAIKDATVSTSTVNPARITTTVQKMRPVSRGQHRFPLAWSGGGGGSVRGTLSLGVVNK